MLNAMSDQIEKELGKRVRTLREQSGLSAREFALMVGRSKAYIIQLENGHRNVSLDTIERIAAGLDVSISDLFKGMHTHVSVEANQGTPPSDKSLVRGYKTSCSRNLYSCVAFASGTTAPVYSH